MLVIRNPQMTALRLAMMRSNAGALAHDIARAHPSTLEGRSERDLARIVDDALVRAWGYGLRESADLHAFAQLAARVSPSFDRHPPFSAILTAPDIAPESKLDRLFQSAGDDWLAAAAPLPPR